MHGWGFPIFMAWIGGSLGTLIVRSFAWRFSIINEPNNIVPQHTEPVAYLGGIGVLLGCMTGLVSLPAEYLLPKGIVIAAIAFTLIGVMDDLRPFSPFQKFILQILAATLAVYLGVKVHITGIAVVDLAFSVIWIVTIVNAFNLTDVSDGLVASLTLGILLAFVLMTNNLSLQAGIVASALLGFLPFNLPRASIFLGDAGSHLTGFLVAAFSMSMPIQSKWCHSALLIFVALVPLFELVFITSVRYNKGIPWWRGSPDHFALRLQNKGWSRCTINALAAVGSFGFASIGLFMCIWPVSVTISIVVCLVTSAYMFKNYLLRSF